MENRPDFFIVGAGKCGTTALYTYLREHALVFMPAVKEPSFFAPDIMGDRRPIRTMQDYLNLFGPAGPAKRIGEASTTYFVSKSAPVQIKAFAPDAKIIIMLRSPVEKIYARFSEGRLNGREHNPSFEAALGAERKEGPSIGVGYMESARYLDKVQRYFHVFGRENVHIIIYDELVQNPSGAYEGVLRFLGLPSDGRTTFPVINANHRARSVALQQFLDHPPKALRKLVVAALPRALRSHLRMLVVNRNLVYETRQPMSPELCVQLKREFRADVDGLGVLIGKDLSHWVREQYGQNANFGPILKY